MALTPDQVLWSYRLLLGRDPESDAVLDAQCKAYRTLGDIRKAFSDTPEFKALVRSPKGEGIGRFLLPAVQDGRIVIEIPTLERPVSQMCTHAQMCEPHFENFCRRVGFNPGKMHRKHWEWAYIFRVLEVEGMLHRGRRGLVFAVGEEPLPSVLAGLGVRVTATDGPHEVSQYWSAGAQYANELQALWHKSIVDWETFSTHVEHGLADMRAIPPALRDYDFVWSSCSLEHLGGLQAGLDFIRNSLGTLRSGGVAVHTTEFNLSSNDDTVDASPTCLYRRRDFERIAAELTDEGHEVLPLNFFPGDAPLDTHVDFPPYSDPHLRMALLNYVTTSAGIVVRKKQ
jgi:hypothetical protein